VEIRIFAAAIAAAIASLRKYRIPVLLRLSLLFL